MILSHAFLPRAGLIWLWLISAGSSQASAFDSLLQLCPDAAGTLSFACGCIPANETASTGAAPSVAGAPAVGQKRILLYRVDFSDAVGAAIASNTAAVLIDDLNNFYRDMSYGLMSFAPAEAGSVITETLRLPQPSTAYDNNFTNLIAATRQVAMTAGYSVSDFDFDIVCTGTKPFLVFGAVAYTGGPGVWLGNNNFNVGVAGHELGHNLGLPHASFWNTGDQSTIGPGVRQEYGDIFDSMGVPGGSTSHFNARFKNFLGWIPDVDAPFITTNGVYRIAAHDHPLAVGLRALRMVRSSSQNYWVEFRQSFNNRFVTNGLTLRWAGDDATNTLLLDATPGTPSLSQDSPLLIGRTFSDRCLGLHITPLGKGGTVPESLDVAVNRGPFPANVAPAVTVMASAETVATGEMVTLQATAADANNDPLAYYWDFGDGSFGGNQSTIQYAWPTAGEFVARCTVTDMKGGTASDSVLVRAGASSTFRVEGRVLRNGLPVESVLVKGAARFTYTDSDGTYRITRLAAGRPTVSAILEGFNVINAGFENPVTLGPNVTGADFEVLPFDLNSFTFVATGSVWKYLDTGVAPASDWNTLLYDDGAWNSGPARLGYGVGGEGTVVSYGTNANNRHITTWFRQRFVVEDAMQVDHLIVRLRRDDGAVVYLNGAELYRENMPAGQIDSSTLAVADVNTSEEPMFFKRLLPSSGLFTGTNVLAVEVHQFRTNSIDLSFDLELAGVSEDAQELRPRLIVGRSGADVSISWPAGYTGWSLFTTDDLESGAWLQSPAAVVTTNGTSKVSILASGARRFYQLRRPLFCAP